LIEAMADALWKNRETTRASLRHASAVLLSCARDADKSAYAALAEKNERRQYRGGLGQRSRGFHNNQ
jgi:hypothetical protein